MTEGRGLGEAFLAGHPNEAARVLEGLPAEEVASFLVAQEAGRAGPVLAAMLPWSAAGILAALPGAAAGGLLRELPSGSAAAILRCLDPGWRRSLRQELPAGRRAVVDLLLGYSPDTVGAWADPGAVVMRGGTTVEEARRSVEAGAVPGACQIYVVDSGNRFLGVVNLGNVLQATAHIRLSEILDKEVPVLSAGAGLDTAIRVPGWDRYGALPVVDGRNRFLGSVSPARLSAPERTGVGPRQGQGAALASLVDTYLRTLGTILAFLWQATGPDQSRRPPDER